MEESERYETVRRQLRERGYLDGRIERFLLRDVMSAGSAAGRLARAALRAAAIGGPLLGALLAGIVADANRRLIGPGDVALLWLYFAILAAAATFLLDLTVGSLIALLARRRGVQPRDVLVAGLVVALPLLGYLLALGWTKSAARTVAGEVAFVSAAVASTLVVAWLAGLVSLAGIIGRTGQVPDRRRRSALILLLVLAPLALALFAGRSLLRAGAAEAPPSIEPASGVVPLLWIGIDGLDRTLLETLDSGEALDGLRAAAGRGAFFPLQHVAGIEPPEVWTTLATGQPARVHGVTAAAVERLPGLTTPLGERSGLEAALRLLLPSRSVPTSAALRRVRALWDAVSLAERSAAVGWWATWPASDDAATARGSYVVTERVLPKLLSGGAPDRDTLPPSLFDRLREDFEEDRARIEAGFGSRTERWLGTAAESEDRRWLWESWLIDAWSWGVAERLAGDPEIRASFVYLPGLEILRHRLAGGAARDPAQWVRAQRLLEAYSVLLGDLIDPVLVEGPRRNVVLVAEPGRAAGPAAEGFVLVAGPAARPACAGPRLAALDVAPLTLALAGFPQSNDMPGRPPDRCLAGAPQAETVASYGHLTPAELPPFSESDREMVERLKSLGYLK